MGSDNCLPELSLELRPPYTPQTISEFLSELKSTQPKSQRLSKLNDYITGLEDELRKIEAFKRELPLSLLLLSDAISTLKEELSKCIDSKVQPSPRPPTAERSYSAESIGLELGYDESKKKSWMSSAQLWSSDSNSFLQLCSEKEESGRTGSENGTGYHHQQPVEINGPGSGPNLSFRENLGISGLKQQGKDENLTEPRLSLVMPGVKSPETGVSDSRRGTICEDGNGASAAVGGGGVASGSVLVTDHYRLSQKKSKHQQPPYQTGTGSKQRRCWSPDLHRRFVGALEKLGGSQAATPKQIRELMQVDGLTNDEVKSHLQKYRLHIRKLPTSSSTQTNDKLIASQDQNDRFEGHSKMDIAQSGSPQGPLLLSLTSAKCSSGGTCADSNEYIEDDQNSDGHSWRSGSHQHHIIH